MEASTSVVASIRSLPLGSNIQSTTMLIVITAPETRRREMMRYCRLLDLGLECLHLRLPGASRAEYEDAIRCVPPAYRHRLVLCDYYDLVDIVGAGGLHFSTSRRDEAKAWAHRRDLRLSTSAHSVDELKAEDWPCGLYTYVLLSPFYDSISKADYPAALSLDYDYAALQTCVGSTIVALGGITPERARACTHAGLGGVAVLGYLAQAGERMADAFMAFARPEVLSVAGHDPSSGAGIVADALAIVHSGGHSPPSTRSGRGSSSRGDRLLCRGGADASPTFCSALYRGATSHDGGVCPSRRGRYQLCLRISGDLSGGNIPELPSSRCQG